MEYPGSFLTKPWRRLILWVFIAAFFITAPLIVLYTTGYRLDVGVGLVHQVGIISIDGIPHDAHVSINDLTQPTGLPARLNALIPGIYQVKLSAKGYHSWEETITVRAKETSYIKDVDLPQNAVPERLSETTPDTFTVLPGKEAVVYTKKTPEGTTLTYQTLASGLPLLVTTTNQAIDHITVSPHEEFIGVQTASGTPFFIETKTLRTLFPITTSSFVFRWDAEGSDNHIFGEYGATIHRFDLLSGTETEYAQKNPRLDWFPYNNTVWILTDSSFISSSLAVENLLPTLLFNQETDWNKALRSSTEGTSWHFFDLRNETVLLKENDSDQIAVVTHKKITALPVHTLAADRHEKKFLLRGQFEIWNVADGAEPAFVYRASEPLVAADFLNKTDLYLVATTHHLFSYQDFYGITTELVDDVMVRNAYAVPATRAIIFSGSYHGKEGIWKLAY